MAKNVDKKQYTFSGHESFPCKTLWLKKGYDFVNAEKDFNAPEAVVHLGVGKNMVAAVRYWYKAFGLNKDAETGWIADYLFDKKHWQRRHFQTAMSPILLIW
ncbi:MAG: DUF4007 family protein [Bacteroidales bacterium]|nr:DUF4007 family protein [Bacteroidales bacterium]